VLISRDFAVASGEALRPIGRRWLRDIDGAQEIFTID
jgi:hypothetical protein